MGREGANPGFHTPVPALTSSASWLSDFCSSAQRAKVISPQASMCSSSEAQQGLLARRLGLFDLLLIGIGATIGVGIFVITGTVARDAGPGVTLCFTLAGATSALNALCFAELASRFPAVVGGAYLYAYTAFNELTAFLVFTQLMFDYHITAASIARSWAGYIVALLELFPFFRGNIPGWIGNGGQKFLGAFSINLLAPVVLLLLTVILCRGVKESSTVNLVMTTTKIIIVVFVICLGAFEIDVANWSPFTPNGLKPIMTGTTIVTLSYVGFDSVANSAEESKKPQRDLPMAIMGSVLVCGILYVGVCLVLTGMIPYQLLQEDAPLAQAFAYRGLKYVSLLISVGAIAGLTTALLVSLYVKSRLYLGLARDGLLPSIFAKVHPKHHTPVQSQIWVGFVPAVIAAIFDVHELSHFLSVGCLIAYSAASASVLILRWQDYTTSQESKNGATKCNVGGICLIIISCCGFGAGLLYRFDASFIYSIIAVVVAIFASATLCRQQDYSNAQSGFSCPGVPIVPAVCIFTNAFLFSQMHHLAFVRFVVVSILTVIIYACYGQFNANPFNSSESIDYHRLADEETQ